MEFKEYKGKNVDEAITNACIDLGIEAAKLEYEVIEKGSNGFLGIGSKPAIIKAKKNQSVEDIARKYSQQWNLQLRLILKLLKMKKKTLSTLILLEKTWEYLLEREDRLLIHYSIL